MNRISINYFLIALSSIFFLAIGFLVYQQIFSGTYGSDTDEHIIFLYKYFYGSENYYIPHPLWHLGVYFTSKILHISIEYAAVIFSSSLILIWIYLVYFTVQNLLRNRNNYIAIMLTFFIIIIGPLCIPWYNKIIYLGQGSPNIWHNVTLWTVKPFALLSILFVIKAIKFKNNLYYSLTIISLIISLFAKPSFAIIFLPTLIIFALIKKIYNKQFIIFYTLLGLLSTLILLYQAIHTFSSGDSKIIFDYLGVWSLSSQNISVSIFLALAFPLTFLFLESKIIYDDYILFAWLQIFIGILLYACLAQSGKYYAHGNFGWSYVLAMSLLYLFSIIKFFEIYNNLHRFKKYILLTLLIIQVFIGIYYFVRILEGQNPLYIAIFI